MAETSEGFQPGMRVRLKDNPMRIGVLTGETAPGRASLRWQVAFPDGNELIPELALERIREEGGNPYEDMRLLRFARAGDLRAALTRARLGGKLADLIYSLNTTNTEFLPYQFKPVLSFLDSPSRGLLIADEVGLGKTIEAGLIWTELRSREDARRLLVLCPAFLRDKWKQELAHRFGVEAQVMDAGETVARLEQAATPQGTHGTFAIIASMQGLRTLAVDDRDDAPTVAGRFARLVENSASEGTLLDLVIVDEAHHLRNPETQTAKLGRALRRMSDGMVLLSATPVHLGSEDLFHLLNLLDPDSFPFESSFDDALDLNAPLVRARDLLARGTPDMQAVADSLAALRTSPLAAKSEALKHFLTQHLDADSLGSVARRLELAEQLDRMNPITKVVSRTRKRDVQERLVVRSAKALRSEMTAVETDFYSRVTHAVRHYCRNRDIGEGFLLTVPQRQMCSSMAAACRLWVTRSEGIDAEIDELIWEAFGGEAGVAPPERNAFMGQLARIARDVGDYQALKAADSKFATLKTGLDDYWARYPGAKVVLFAYFRETLRYLEERFAEIGIRTVLLMGGMDKSAALAEFAHGDGPPLLLASEVASEGIDLQFSSVVVNYDLPWNPMRIEQRIGRIDRIGQRADKVLILNILLGDSLDERVYERLFHRLAIFERSLGGIEAVLGEQIRQMSYELLRHELTAEQELKVIEQTRVAVENRTRTEDALEEQAGRLVAHGDYLQQRVSAARDLNRYVTSEDLRVHVSDFLTDCCPGAQLVEVGQGDDPLWEIDIGHTTRADFSRFLDRSGMQGRTRLGSAAAGRQRCVFENVLRRPRSDAETISQYHPLIAYIGSRQRDDARYRNAVLSALRGSAIGVEPGVLVFAVERWTQLGENRNERLVFEGWRLDGDEAPVEPHVVERLLTNSAIAGRGWSSARGELDGDRVHDCFVSVMDALQERYREFMDAAARNNADRVRFQLEQVDRRETAEISRIKMTIDLLRLTGRVRTIPANEGRIEKIRARAEFRRAQLRLGSDFRHESRLVCAGVLLLS